MRRKLLVTLAALTASVALAVSTVPTSKSTTLPVITTFSDKPCGGC